MIAIDILRMHFPGEGDMALLLALMPNQTVIGTATVKRSGPAAEFARLFVCEGQRRAGVGRLLVDRAVEIGRAAGCVSLSCCVDPSNKPALLFYSRLGFTRAFQFGDGDLLLTRPIAPLSAVQSTGGAS